MIDIWNKGFANMTGKLTAVLLALMAAPAMAQDINFGDDSSEWARDGECDDRRFFGPGMALSVTWQYVGQDATDCRSAYDAGRISLWNMRDAMAATQCAAIDFGDDSGGFPNDGECDDARFEGLAVAHVLTPDDIRRDASDCSRLCFYGAIALRDY